MGRLPLLLLLLLFLVGIRVLSQHTHQLCRNDFPPDFVFGAATSAYQVEGAAAEGGRTPSIWDTYTHAEGLLLNQPEFLMMDQKLEKLQEDVKLMHDMGLDAYRFSISWSRLIPGGRGDINPKGLQYYNNLINELIKYGIEPHVTLHHLDLPQILEDEYGGWLNEKIVEDFTAYADVCFREFGDRVTYWTTLNEPNMFALGGYDKGILPPQRCSSPYGYAECETGNSCTEPYIVTHNMLLAHAAVARLYKQKYMAKQHGLIGITIFTFWFAPQTNGTEDVAAAKRALDFMLDYPEVMKKNAGSRLPSFSRTQSALMKGSFDFIGINHYETITVSNDHEGVKEIRDYMGDMLAIFVINSSSTSGQFLPTVFPVHPWGLQGVLEHIKTSYRNPPIFVHENGYGMRYSGDLNDTARINYLSLYLERLLEAVRNGSNTNGYFVWSFVDCFELLYGYQATFGLYQVDFNDKELSRQARYSAHWYSTLLKKKKRSFNIEKLTSSSTSRSTKQTLVNQFLF
ncbi:6-phospho-beta-galactosidase [Nymphaea thermarum]|nr:6-phospho-beta-galactosidase [Nymphaea thermarum]